MTKRRDNSLSHCEIASITVKALIIVSPLFMAIDRFPDFPLTLSVFALVSLAGATLAFIRWLNNRDDRRCAEPRPVRQPFEADTSAGRGSKARQSTGAVNSARLNSIPGSAPESD
jgi:hypothetical protein